MPQPTSYTPTTDFSQQEASNASGRSTVNTAALDTELANIETTLDQTLANLTLIQRDDGRLKDLACEVHTLSPEVLNLIGGLRLRGLWAASTAYSVSDIASNGAYTYVCRTAHTSGLAFDGQYWAQFGFTSGADAAQAAANAQFSANDAASSATAAAESATGAAVSATAATTQAANASASAGTATTKAGEAATSATNASNSATAAQTAAANLPNATTAGPDKFLQSNPAGTGWDYKTAPQVLSALSATLAGIAAGTTATASKNKIINGNFAVNQRTYVSGAAVGAGLYGHDRWKMAASGDTYAFSTTANVATITIPAGKVLRQVIEGVNLQSGTHTLSWTGTAQGKIGAGSLSASGVTGTATGGTDLTIEFGPGTVSKVQFEEGSIATPFEHRPIGLELALCRRYFEITPIIHSNSPSTQYQYMGWKVEKRATPTLVLTQLNGSGGPTMVTDSLTGKYGIHQALAPSGVGTMKVTGESEL